MDSFRFIIQSIIGTDKNTSTISGINAAYQFRPDETYNESPARNLNAAFLIALSGDSHPLYHSAVKYLDHIKLDSDEGKLSRFYADGLKLIDSEITERLSEDKTFEHALNTLFAWLKSPENRKNRHETIEKCRQLFFPEGLSICDKREEKISELRAKRKINISRLNPLPITNPSREILFTSNILITIPLEGEGLEGMSLSDSMTERLKKVRKENQKYWYDHPVPVGISPENNEILYGLLGLDSSVEFEKKRGTVEEDARIVCALSVSVTHEGLQEIAKDYIEEELRQHKEIKHLDLYVFTDSHTASLVDDILIPAARKYLTGQDSLLKNIFGVDGEYGKHYSFLKAISAFWQVFIDNNIKGTFKIDLDQIFPQHELVEQSGFSAFEHFKTPLWGAEGIDSDGNEVDLGLIAGALVNKSDINTSLFSPDVCFPAHEIYADQLIFFSALPQALSTEAEMMARYNSSDLDGSNNCLHRIHVTGGTCGILVKSLRNYRPFTPTFIGRAEDQAYILSILFDGNGKRLRYAHKDGLIMRHDKEAFAGEAIKKAAIGKLIGDYVRTLMFSYYARALPWSLDDIKSSVDPFTGCFISKIPLTIVYLRFALKVSSFFAEDHREKKHQGIDFQKTGASRLNEMIHHLIKDPNPLIEQFEREKDGWNLFYDILDKVEIALKQNDKFASELRNRAEALVQSCKINFTQ